MVRLAIVNEKGGVGKTFLACQLALYCALKLEKRVLVLDLDSQGNTTKCLSKQAVKSPFSMTELLVKKTLDETKIGHEPFLVISADEELKGLERQGTQAHYAFIGNIFNNLRNYFSDYDIVIMDTNPNDDVRSNSALCLATHVISPIELAQESIDGVAGINKRIQQIKEVNPEINFIGLVPNRVESKEVQKEALREILLNFKSLLLVNENLQPVFFPSSTAILEAQRDGIPLWNGKKSTFEKIWKKVEPNFQEILKRTGLIG